MKTKPAYRIRMMTLSYGDLNDITCIHIAAVLLRTMPEVLRVRTNFETCELEVLYSDSMKNHRVERAILHNAQPLGATLAES